MERKYPHANRAWAWQFVFPLDRLSQDPRSQITRWHHLHESGLQRTLKQAVRQAAIFLPFRILKARPGKGLRTILQDFTRILSQPLFEL
jgi:hypothetical protein